MKDLFSSVSWLFSRYLRLVWIWFVEVRCSQRSLSESYGLIMSARLFRRSTQFCGVLSLDETAGVRKDQKTTSNVLTS